MSILNKLILSQDEKSLLEDLRQKVSKQFGVTLIGNGMTLRWNFRERHVEAYMIILEIETPVDSQVLEERTERLIQMRKRVGNKKLSMDDWEAEMYWVEEGEYPK